MVWAPWAQTSLGTVTPITVGCRPASYPMPMIKVLSNGSYKLIETKQQIKILYLDDTPYVWLFLKGIGHVLETTNKPHKAEHILAEGRYRLYEVKDDPKLSDNQRLELVVGPGKWQGYLLLTGLPNQTKKRSMIIATDETISSPKNVA